MGEVKIGALLLSAVLALLLVIANVTGAGMILPQVLRLHRRRAIDGVSPVWLGVGVGLNTWWTIYGFQQQLWGILPVSIGSAGLYLASTWLYRRIAGPGSLRRFAITLLSVLVLPSVVLAAASWEAVGLTLGLAYSVQFSPAAFAAFSSTKVDGISPSTWVMALMEAAIWCFYGVVVDDIALLVGGAGGMILSLAIVLRLAWLGHRTSHDLAATTSSL